MIGCPRRESLRRCRVEGRLFTFRVPVDSVGVWARRFDACSRFVRARRAIVPALRLIRSSIRSIVAPGLRSPSRAVAPSAAVAGARGLLEALPVLGVGARLAAGG